MYRPDHKLLGSSRVQKTALMMAIVWRTHWLKWNLNKAAQVLLMGLVKYLSQFRHRFCQQLGTIICHQQRTFLVHWYLQWLHYDPPLMNKDKIRESRKNRRHPKIYTIPCSQRLIHMGVFRHPYIMITNEFLLKIIHSLYHIMCNIWHRQSDRIYCRQLVIRIS